MATGGYGRGELAPGSDIDLLFVRPFKQTAWGESVIEFILYMLWDLGLKVGHATRSLAECVRLSKLDVTIRTAILEARYLWGDQALYEELRKKFWSEVATGNGRDFVEAKLAERNQRHERQGESRYLVEPNIKEGKGGLRDLQTLYWIGKYLYHVDDAADLVEHGVFTRDEYKHLPEGGSLSVECARASALPAGPRRGAPVASTCSRRWRRSWAMSMPEKPRRAVEAFMRAYFLVAKDVGDLTRIFCAALEEQHRKPRPSLTPHAAGLPASRAASDDDFYVENGRLTADPAIFRQDPGQYPAHVPDRRRQGRGHPSRCPAHRHPLAGPDHRYGARTIPDANQAFLETLTSRHDPERALRLMNEAGVLGRFIPEFGHAVGLMQFNMYHHYTVDEHLIRAVGNVAAIERGEHKDDNPLATESSSASSRATCCIAPCCCMTWPRACPATTAMSAPRSPAACARAWACRPPTPSAVAWLVKNHLVMSDTAQRRDVSDPKTVRDFVDQVQSPEMLRLLLVLTVADIRAVGPGVWNGWKGQLLRELYYAAENMMTGGDQAPARGAPRGRRQGGAGSAAGRFHAGAARAARSTRHYDNYWLAFENDELERHARLIAKADAGRRAAGAGSGRPTISAPSPRSCSTRPTMPACSRNSPAPSPCRAARSWTPRPSPPPTASRWMSSRCRMPKARPLATAERLARLRQTIEKTLRGEIWPRQQLASAAAEEQGQRLLHPAQGAFRQ